MSVFDNVVRPTTLVRRLMYAHGAVPFMTFTNSYSTCRTVKCYLSHIHSLDEFKQDLLEIFTKLEFGCPQVYTNVRERKAFVPGSSLIVRIPHSLQEAPWNK